MRWVSPVVVVALLAFTSGCRNVDPQTEGRSLAAKACRDATDRGTSPDGTDSSVRYEQFAELARQGAADAAHHDPYWQPLSKAIYTYTTATTDHIDEWNAARDTMETHCEAAGVTLPELGFEIRK